MANYYENIPDYTELHEMYEAEQDRRIERNPTCDCCDEKIVEDDFYIIDGEYICEHCLDHYLDEHCKVKTNDYLKEYVW